ncbi:MAG: hypothetical protein A3D44_04060 [Candidatus Staskawiczbacteria bacterium RIFCSPHIGHO2_02_FULL_42_22]|uniref:Uncharacterized protein n=1 Tax=Candidatus Staskawiczbacteria bacterium RIFCSPHIGHO2_02_FULL_42_22 TaxID=1802207 RepID=A0A1G2I2K2_9BACT|nr:MAG: hypothetical protein A3D44_04060 [Candidatus Staskawiczbacteria bacterium RIFCSPHIGHO2_02_FULL_42_22]
MSDDPQVVAAAKLLRDKLKLTMERKKITSVSKLARYLCVPRPTIQDYFSDSNTSRLPTPKTLNRIRRRASEITEEDARIIETGFSRMISRTRSEGAKTKIEGPKAGPDNRPAPSVPPPFEQSAEPESLALQLIAMILEDAAKASSLNPIALLSQAGLGRYSVGDMPWILTKDNFRCFDITKWTPEEQGQFLAYTNLVLEQARKCMLLLAQFEPGQVRDELGERLARNADLLWQTFRVATHVLPGELIKDIDLELMCKSLNSNQKGS